MSLITGINLSKSFGAEDIFSSVTVSIPRRARIGLVGPNGVGKTTLLRILLGMEEASSGDVQLARGARLAYLPQEVRVESSRTVWQECLDGFADLLEMQAELRRLEALMSDPAQAEQALASYGRLEMEFDRRGGYTYESRARQTLMGLGFAPGEEHRPWTQLSGGQRTRAYLAKLLLAAPDVLMLDEPTNHLDIAAIEWLEAFLKDFTGGVVIVSHDRYFLDQTVDTVWEMTPALEVYHGNYSAYLNQRAERYQRMLEEYQAQQAFIEKEEEYIRRNIAGQNTRQAQGRRTRLERMLAEARITPPPTARRLTLHLAPAARSGDLVVRTFGLSVGYADEGRPLFTAPDLTLQRGECAAIVGPNGAGKTTFLKTLLEQVPPYQGEALLGASLKIGYFAQAHEGLQPHHTLMEEINAVAPGLLPAQVRDYLAQFLFSGDDVFKKVENLSGGERGRLALARLALEGANLLLLDEPTNHLDLPSQEILQTVLRNFGGTILLVSHDRYLIDALATQIWEVLPEEERLQVFDGTYSEYRAWLQAREQSARTAAEPVAGVRPGKEVKANGRPAEGLSKNDQRRRQQRLQALEHEIARLEDQLHRTGKQLETPPADAGKVQQLANEYNQLQQKLEVLMEEWAELG